MDKRYKPFSPTDALAARRALTEELAAAPSTPVPAVIKKIRTGLRLTIAEYAKLCGVSARALADIERGATSPTLATVEKLLRPLGLQPGAVPLAQAGTPALAGSRAPGPSLDNAQDRSTIDPSAPWEVEYWTGELGISAGQLVDAIQAVGPTIGAVRRHFGRQ
jgi:transcriptional regulator with XRE-family HTH domain